MEQVEIDSNFGGILQMIGFIFKRALWLVALLFVLTYACFAMVHFSKGSVAYAANSQGVSVALKAQIESNLNLDKGLNEQYLLWLGRAIKGDFSHSLITGESVNEIINERLGATLTLGGISLMGLFILSVFLAVISVIYKDKFIDKAINYISMGFFAMPVFALCLVLMLFFSVYLGILPSFGNASIGFESDLTNKLKHIILPASALILAHLGVYVRIFRTILLDSLNQPFIESAFARGLSTKKIYFHLVLKHAFPPILTYFSAHSVAFLVNSYIVESVFSYGGVGNLVVESIIFKDYPIILAVIILSVVAVVVLNAFAEICANIIDSRKIYA